MKPQRNRGMYWTRARLWAVVIWLLLLLGVPTFLELAGLIPEGGGFVPASLLLISGIAILVDRPAFRVGVAWVVVAAFLFLRQPVALRDIVDGLDYRMQDAFFNIRGPIKPSDNILIVDIDHKSLEEVGQWPWPRTQVAQAVRKIKQDGARVIGFDIVFAERDRLSLRDWTRRIASLGLDLSAHKESDEGLAGKLPTSSDKWGLRAEPAVIKHIVLDDWYQRLSRLYKGWQLNRAQMLDSEWEQAIVSKYLEYAQTHWIEQEELKWQRSMRAGLSYRMRSYQPPQVPLNEMARASSELFYLAHFMGEEQFLREGAEVIMDNDLDLGEAFKEGHVVAGGLFITERSAGTRMSSFRQQEASHETDGMVVSSGFMGAREVFPGIRQAIRQVVNVPEVQERLYHQGMFNIVPDKSGSARWYTMLMQAPVFQRSLSLKEGFENLDGEALLDIGNYEERILSQMFTYPSLALEMLRAANGYDVVQMGYQNQMPGLFLKRNKGFDYAELEEGKGSPTEPGGYYSLEQFRYLQGPERFIPLDFKADFTINFYGYGGPWQPESEYGPEYYFRYISLADVIAGRFQAGTFKDKYVIIGSTDPTLSDLVGNPFRPAYPGVEVHATVLDNLLTENYLHSYGDYETLYTFLGILFGGLFLVAVVAYMPAWMAGLATLIVMLGLPVFAYYSMVESGIVINFVYPWMSAGVLSTLVVLTNFFVEGRERRFVVSQFAKMVSHDVLHKLRDDPEGASLSGQRTIVTVLFSDIEAFTTISEKLPPKELVDLLNAYFTPMSEIILQHDGFIDKFMGDAIMSCWGVPFPDKDHAVKACMAALEQQEALVELADRFAKQYNFHMKVRMGLASGEVSAALMGSKTRKNYTVMGDTVNFGSRLEPACRDYGIQIMISENTYRWAQDHVEARLVDKLVVKGKTMSIPVYELLGKKGKVDASVMEKAHLYEEALKLHWDRRWDAAMEKLDQVFKIDPEDGPSHHLMTRIRKYKQKPPSDDWDGAVVLELK